MIRMLAAKCPVCGNIIHVKMEDDQIAEVHGGERARIGSVWRGFRGYREGKRIWRDSRKEHSSSKTIRCTALTNVKISGNYPCGRHIRLSTFKQIAL